MKIQFVILLQILTFGHSAAFGQCDDLKSWSDSSLTEHLELKPENWEEAYHEYFQSDTSAKRITADSVLISYLSHPENQTNHGLMCSYFLATKYAEIELENSIEELYTNLGKVDSINFVKSQASWQEFYKNEQEFINHAFVGYANYSKYGHGREIMISNSSKIYDSIKNRIFDVKRYIELSAFSETTNDE